MKKLLCVLLSALLFLAGCGQSAAPVKARLSVDSDKAPVLVLGERYKLQYTSDSPVVITAEGTFDEETLTFTASEAGTFAIVLTAGEGEAAVTETVTVTVLGEGDKEALSALVKEARALVKDDYTDFGQLEGALALAEETLLDPSAPQSAVDSAAASLENAMAQLLPRSFGERKAAVYEDSISYGGRVYYKNYYTNFEEVAAAVAKINGGTEVLFSQYDAAVRAALGALVRLDGGLSAMDLERGIQMAKLVFADYYTQRSAFLGGNIVYDVLDANGNHIRNEGTGNRETDFWTLTSLLALMVRLDSVTEESNKDKVDAVIDAMAYHCGVRNDNHAGEGGAPRDFRVYAVHRSWLKNSANVYGDHGEESVFDDQIWAAQEFLNAYNLYHEASYLEKAVELTEYIYLVGNDPYLGGIYWGQAYTSRHACSNAPFVKLAVGLYEATGEGKYLEWAKNIYAFAYDVLRDKSDQLYYDLVQTVYENGVSIWDGGKSIQNGGLDTKKYSYNSGSMISAGVALYNATGEEHYLEEAKKTAASCRTYFGNDSVKAGYNVYPGSDGNTTYSWFNLILFKGYLDLVKADPAQWEYLDEVQQVYDHDYENYFRSGYIPTTGLVGWTEGRNSFSYRVLMDHVTNADVLLLLGQYQQLREDKAGQPEESK